MLLFCMLILTFPVSFKQLSIFAKNSRVFLTIRVTFRVSNSLDSDQGSWSGKSYMPWSGSNYLQSVSANDTGKKRINAILIHLHHLWLTEFCIRKIHESAKVAKGHTYKYSTFSSCLGDQMSRDMWFPSMWHFDKCIDSDEPVQPPFKLRTSKRCSVSSLTLIK